MPPRIRPFEFESAVFAGEPVQITCLVNKGDKPLRISWYFHSTELTSSQTGVYTSFMGDRSNILSIPSTGISNGGNYTCVAQNAVGMDYYSAFLEVNGITLSFNIHFAYRLLSRFYGMTAFNKLFFNRKFPFYPPPNIIISLFLKYYTNCLDSIFLMILIKLTCDIDKCNKGREKY